MLYSILPSDYLKRSRDEDREETIAPTGTGDNRKRLNRCMLASHEVTEDLSAIKVRPEGPSVPLNRDFIRQVVVRLSLRSLARSIDPFCMAAIFECC